MHLFYRLSTLSILTEKLNLSCWKKIFLEAVLWITQLTRTTQVRVGVLPRRLPNPGSWSGDLQPYQDGVPCREQRAKVCAQATTEARRRWKSVNLRVWVSRISPAGYFLVPRRLNYLRRWQNIYEGMTTIIEIFN